MSDSAPYHFTHTLQVRYSDLDPQWHVNNARVASFLEEARLAYLGHLGLLQHGSFLDFPLILADLHIAYIAPIQPGCRVQTGVRTLRIGHKSLTLEYCLQDADSGKILARAETVLVAYDFHTGQSVPVSSEWRERLSTFEGIPFQEKPIAAKP